MVKYEKGYELGQDTNLVAWTAERVHGRRPEIGCRKGTKVRLRREFLPNGTYVTAFVKRHKMVWSLTRFVDKAGNVTATPSFKHAELLKELA